MFLKNTFACFWIMLDGRGNLVFLEDRFLNLWNLQKHYGRPFAELLGSGFFSELLWLRTPIKLEHPFCCKNTNISFHVFQYIDLMFRIFKNWSDDSRSTFWAHFSFSWFSHFFCFFMFYTVERILGVIVREKTRPKQPRQPHGGLRGIDGLV